MTAASGPPPPAPGEPGTRDSSSPPARPALPSVTLPTGGGAIRGIDEKLTVGLATGAATLTVPIATSPARHDFGPKLELLYDSGAGNGPFGLGWRLSPPAVTRKTSRGLPRYQDSADSDVFVLSDAEDLVPALVEQGGGWVADTYTTAGITVRRYRPRVEQAFTRVERWTDDSTGDTHWRCVTRDNVTSVFGRDPAARVADPADPGRVYSWLLELTYDALGNAVTYGYKAEDLTNVPADLAEVPRSTATNRYLKRVRYAPTTPYQPGGTLPAAWSFEVVLDYGEHDPDDPTPEEATGWAYRADPFSAYRSGFELRTRRLCRRILTFHTFPELGADPVLVGSTDLGYSTDAPADPTLPVYSLLSSVTRTGYIRHGAGYTRRSMPPLDLGYSGVTVDGTVRLAGPDTLANLPAGVTDDRWQFTDVDGEGLSGVLTSDDRGWYYKRNVSAYAPDGSPPAPRFEPLRVLASMPSGTSAASRLSLVDLHGDGHLAAVDFAAPRPGYHARTDDGGWAPFTPFRATATVDFADPNVRRVDLDGDGLADVLMTADDGFTWYAWQPTGGTGGQRPVWQPADGYAAGGRVVTSYDEDRGPAVVLALSDRSVFLADMTGDGLSDLVRVRNGEVCYWPNLGYGRFGAKITMDGAPWFDTPDVFDARRVRVADIDGSGTADLVYLAAHGVRLWFNRSGNGFAAPVALAGPAGVTDLDNVTAVDLLGSGTSCLVWSTPLPTPGARQLRYVDLLGGVKPHLLTRVANNMGAETTLEYAPSTRFYLADRLAGRPWATRLAFPVQVVTRKQVRDVVSATRLVSMYAYHHGYFDGVEREFRGFAMVERSDADFVPADYGTGTFTGPPGSTGGEFTLPPVRTRTWLHTGAFVGGRDIAAVLRAEYYAGDPQAVLPSDPVLPAGAGAEDLREACRALRGRALRTETYADDGTPAAIHPYAVAQTRHEVARLQPAQGASCGSFVAADRETVTYHYERDPADPRVAHQITLEIDGYATVRKQASVAYPRRNPAFDAQAAPAVTYTEHDVTHVDTEPDWYRIAVPVETREYEIGGLAAPAPGTLLAPDALLAFATGAAEIPYEQDVSGATAEKRRFGRTRTVYRADDLSAALATGVVQSRALPDRAYRQVVTPGAVAAAYAGRLSGAAATTVATGEAGYLDLDSDGCWWAPGPRTFYSPDPTAPDAGYAAAHFFLPQGEVDAFGGRTDLGWEHDLMPTRTSDPVGNVTTAQVNYRVMRPWLVTDTNGNRSGVRFDELGLVVATALLGKPQPGGGDEGDHLDLGSVEAAPGDDPTQTLDYAVDAYRTWADDPSHDPDRPAPVYAHTRARVRHQDPATPWIETYTYTDGLGRVALTKAQAEPGPAPARDAQGTLERDGHGALVLADTPDRWVGTGRVVHDNKANPVKRYEPFFDSGPGYDVEADLVEWGVTAITRYDPLGRAVRVDRPDGTVTLVEFDPWRQLASDANDTVLDSDWYAARSGGGLGAAAQDAATKAAAHAGTPAVSDLDPLGRVFRTVADGPSGQFVTWQVRDIQGRVRQVVDALGRVAMSTAYDMTGATVHVTSIDAGERVTLADIGGRPVRQWDSRGQRLRTTYDAARRPVATYLAVGTGTETMCAATAYGEGVPGDAAANLRGAVYQRRDSLGVATTVARDFHGDVLTARREVVTDPTIDPDWSDPPALDPPLTTTTTYDALKRVVSLTTPDGSVTRPVFGARSLLASVGVTADGATTGYATSVSYDPKGQRLSIGYGNGAVTTYTYEPETFRLATLVTTRPSGGGPVQDLTYTYDPVGNVTRVVDAAQSTVFFANQLVAPVGDYAYDVIYRLVSAAGREHIGQAAGADDSPYRGLPLPADAQAMRNYTEDYRYDLVGNLSSVAHHASGGDWTRGYVYDNGAATPATNRLTSTTVGATTEAYAFDPNGNIAAMPHLSGITWDYRDQLRSTSRQVVADGTTPTTWYAYDADNLRGRKATTRADGSVASERVYLGPYERYREYAPGGALTLQRETVVVPDGSRHLVLVETTTVDIAHPGTTPATTTRYQLDDRLGSACVELDEHAAVISYEEYYPYGATSFQAGRSQAEVSLKRYRYTGREHDDETGFAYHGARYYAPWLGRWTRCDPAGLVDGTGLYTYSRDNPVRLVDPAGTNGNDPPPDPHPAPPPTPEPPADPPGDPAVPSPAASAGASITPPGSSLIGYSGNFSLVWPPQAMRGGGGQGLVVAGLTKRLQLQVGAGAGASGQDTAPSSAGATLGLQLQYNFFDDPAEESNFVVLSLSGSDMSSPGSPPTLAGGASLQYGHEWIHRRYGTADWSQPRLQSDLNVGLGAAANQGALTPGTTFDSLVTPMASYSLTWTPRPYYSDALTATGAPTAPSSVAPYAVGFDVYASGGLGQLSVPGATPGTTTSRLGGAFTGGVDIFGSIVSPRLDSGVGLGNNRIGLTGSVGVFGTLDTSGTGGTVGGFGVRGALTLWFGRGSVPTQRDQQQ